MDFAKLRVDLQAKGYARRTADAKIAHDIVLAAIRDAGFHDHLTVKGGIVMSGITDLARRATMDMDVDFLRYSLGESSLRKFVARLNRHSECDIALIGEIADLRQQDYRGKRLNLIVTDERGHSVRTKVDIGVHTYESIAQKDYDFRVVSAPRAVRLLTNTREQMFVEKLKSLLRIGPVSTRFKDVYDMYYLTSHIRKAPVRDCLDILVFKDARMVETNIEDVLRRLDGIFANKTFMRRLANPNVAWLDESPDEVVAGIRDFLYSLFKR